jgi:starch synthase
MGGSIRILYVSAECTPYAKAGGLGDVTGSLPRFLKKAGNEPIVVIPMYSFIDVCKFRITVAFEKMGVRLGNRILICNVFKSAPDDNVPVYFIDYEPYFGRPGIYDDKESGDYPDNPERFTFLSAAALRLCRELNFSPGIVHANDWHTAVLPAYLKRLYKDDPLFSHTASVLTIHNLAYQGRYKRYYYDSAGLGEEDFTPEKFECYGEVNFLKGGIHFADIVNTVSKGYAAETRTEKGGYGLDHYLRNKGEDYIGIINGADYQEWNPETDSLIPENYTAADMSGKYLCKIRLQTELNLVNSADTPVIAVISRLVYQKGLYLLAECIEGIMNNMDVQFAILGSGDNRLETYFRNLQEQYPGRVGSFIGYSNELAHLIEAGSDLFLMPSLYEPCGLNQIYSLKYGTVPVVRATGGLDDTIENYDQERGEGTGFKFEEASSKAIYGTVAWALETYTLRKTHFEKLIRNGMEKNFSWDRSADEYIHLYEKALENKKGS